MTDGSGVGGEVARHLLRGLHSSLWVMVVVGMVFFGELREARGETGWDLSVMGGVENVGSRDEMGSPLAYRGRGFPGAVRTERRGPRLELGMEVGAFIYGINGGRLEAERAEVDRHWAESVSVDLALWGQRVVATPRSHRLALGLQISHWTFYRSYHYDPTQIGSVETWDAPLTADVRADLQRSLGPDLEVRLAASVPLAGRMMRPNYAIRGDERIALIEERRRVLNGRWMTLNRFQMIRGEAALSWRVSQRWSVTTQYRIAMFTYRDDTSTQAFSQRGLAGIRFVFF